MPIKANNCLYIYLGLKKKSLEECNIAREKERAHILIKPNKTQKTMPNIYCALSMCYANML